MKLEGRFEFQEATIPLNNTLNKIMESGCNRLFVDLSKTNYLTTNNALMELQRIFKEAGLAHSYKQAVYVSHDFQERKAVENYCYFHGWCIKFFTNTVTAKQWLWYNSCLAWRSEGTKQLINTMMQRWHPPKRIHKIKNTNQTNFLLCF